MQTVKKPKHFNGFSTLEKCTDSNDHHSNFYAQNIKSICFINIYITQKGQYYCYACVLINSIAFFAC